MSDVRMVKLGDVLTFVGVPEKITEPAIEKYVTVQNNGRGAIRRVIKDGKSPVPFTGYRIKPGQFIYSRIDARNGAFAIIPEELDNFVVSKDFPIFEVQNHLVTPQYLLEFLKSGNIQKIIQNLSRGATNRQRIKEAEFLNFPFPLPSLEEQKGIVSILDKAKSIEEARERQLAALDELEYAIYNEIFADFPLEATLEDLGIDFVSGKNLVGTGENIHQHNKVLKVSAVSHGYFKSQEVKPLPADYTPPSSHLVHKDDILFSRASGSLQLVGVTCPVTEDLEDTYLPDKIWRVETTDSTRADVKFIHHLLKSPASRYYIENAASGASGVKNISKKKMMNLPCPTVPLETQKEFLNKISTIHEQYTKTREYINLLPDLHKNLQRQYF